MTTPNPTTVWQAPAKLNLFLHVVGRRADGYHLIQSAMQLVDLADAISITVRDDGRIERATPIAGVSEDDDLTIRAARLLQAAAGSTRGATIAVLKRIPQGGGLGGGSSDAATTLLALNRLWEIDWPRRRLAALGLTLGADVPFFVEGRDAFVEGIGETLTPMALPAAHYAVIHPGVAVPTATIFGAAELTRDTAALKISDFAKNASRVLNSADNAPATTGLPDFRNDLEPVAGAHFEAVRDALEWLAGHSDRAQGAARMSGSGACVFRRYERAVDAAAAIAALPAGWSGWGVQSVAVHPHRGCAVDDAAPVRREM